jgi:hypothetical protein
LRRGQQSRCGARPPINNGGLENLTRDSIVLVQFERRFAIERPGVGELPGRLV